MDLIGTYIKKEPNPILSQTINGTSATHNDTKENPLPPKVESSLITSTEYKSNINEMPVSTTIAEIGNIEQCNESGPQQPMHFDQAVGFLNKIKV